MESIVFDKFESVQVNDLSEQIGGTISVVNGWGDGGFILCQSSQLL